MPRAPSAAVDPGTALRVRVCRPEDIPGLERIGHPPGLARMFCPTPTRRAAWSLLGRRAVTFVAEDPGTGTIVANVQFVRSRRRRDTWMFGHWRVAAALRRRGIGGRVLAGGWARLPRATSLYSYVSPANTASMAAHARLGFEAAPTLRGMAPLGLLTTLGPPLPAVVLDGAAARDRDLLFSIYARALGVSWLRLFPGLDARNALGGGGAWLRALAVSAVRTQAPARGLDVVLAGGAAAGPAGFVLWEAGQPTLYAVPAACDTGLLARLANRLPALGARRDTVLELRGLPPSFAERNLPLDLQSLMTMPDVATQWSGPPIPHPH